MARVYTGWAKKVRPQTRHNSVRSMPIYKFVSLKDSTPHLKYLAILHRNLSLVAWFLTLIFHNVVWQHMRGAVGFSVTRLLQIFQGIFV